MTPRFSFDVPSDGGLVLSVGECCLQTAAKRAHRELAAALLEAGAATATLDQLGPLADLLELFLTGTDFAALRANHPELAGGTRCGVRIVRLEDGRVGWEMVQPQ